MIRTRMAAVAVAALTPLLLPAQAQAASWAIAGPVSGTATVQKLGKTLTIPAGSTFSGTVTDEEIAAGNISGDLDLKTITTQITVLIPVFGTVNATVKIIPTRKAYIAKGPDRTIVGKAYFKIGIPRISPVLVPFTNLVQSGCGTPEIEAPLAVDPLTDVIHATSTFTIPSFSGCSLFFGVRDAVVTGLVSGPGNKLDVTIGPLSITEVP